MKLIIILWRSLISWNTNPWHTWQKGLRISDFEGIPSTSSGHQLVGFKKVNQILDLAQEMVTRQGWLIVESLDATIAIS